MKNSISAVIVILFIVAAGIGYYFYPEPQKPILGRALVLAFASATDNQIDLIHQWEKLDLSVEFANTCTRGSEAKRVKCIRKSITNSLTRSESASKPLLLLADKNSSQVLLSILNENNFNQVSALILLRANAATSVLDNFKIPKTLVISGINDIAEDVLTTRVMASNIRSKGQWAWSTMLAEGGNGLLSHPVLPHMISFLLNDNVNSFYRTEFKAESQWQHPIVNNNKFFELTEFVETYPIDNDIQRILNAFYAYDLNLLKQWPLNQYKAFNLLKYRDYLPKDKQGQFVTFANRKGHRFYLDLQRYEQYKPEIVIAIDDEDNLYRMTSFYKTKRYNSWEKGGPDKDTLYSQSLGAFIHFQAPPPAHLELPYLQYSSILFDSIEFTDQNPYEDLQELSEPAFGVLTLNCIPCHSVNGIGGAAHHLDYLTVKPQPGFAQPLHSYSKDVLENFFFNQTATAQLIGVNPNYVEETIGEELLTWLLAKQ